MNRPTADIGVVIRLPWPPSVLSPNARPSKFGRVRAVKSYRRACWISTLEQSPHRLPEGPLRLRMLFRPPRPRRGPEVDYDRDNLSARMKAGIDGMCDALDINDRDFAEAGGARVGEPTNDGEVLMWITADEPWDFPEGETE